MKTKLTYFFLFLVFLKATSQTLDFDLIKANSCSFSGNVYVFGLLPQAKGTSFRIYKLNKELKKADSSTVDLGKTNADALLQLNSDTLHDFLNIYLQKKEKKLVQILRYTKKFELFANIEDVDVARLNSISTFENEIYYTKNEVYTIKVSNDTSGKQFYLNKYSLKSEQKNFEYEPKWQFPFERRNINSAHIVYATKNYVLMYVNVIDGLKRGQWMLKVNASTGLLIRGTKLNDKGELNFYTYGKMILDTSTRQLFVIGQKFTEAEFNQKDRKLNIVNKPFLTIYMARIDSLGEMEEKNEFKIPVVEQKGNKAPNSYILRVDKFAKSKEGNFTFEADLFKGNNTGCYSYCTSSTYSLTQTEEKLMFEKSTAFSNPDIERFYFTLDKLDMNGKTCADSLQEFEKLFYRNITFGVKQAYKLNELGNRIWILKKSDTKKGMESFVAITPVKNIYQTLKLEDIPKAENPSFIWLSLTQVAVSRQTAAEKFQLKVYNW